METRSKEIDIASGLVGHNIYKRSVHSVYNVMT